MEHDHTIGNMTMLDYYHGNTLNVNESLYSLNIGKPTDFKASAGVKNDPRTHIGVKIDPRNPFTLLFLGTLTTVKLSAINGHCYI